MIKAVATQGKRKIVMLGLSFGNLDKFRQHPGDTFIRIDGEEMGLPVDIVLFSGETEADCAKSLAAGIGPDTKIHRT